MLVKEGTGVINLVFCFITSARGRIGYILLPGPVGWLKGLINVLCKRYHYLITSKISG